MRHGTLNQDFPLPLVRERLEVMEGRLFAMAQRLQVIFTTLAHHAAINAKLGPDYKSASFAEAVKHGMQDGNLLPHRAAALLACNGVRNHAAHRDLSPPPRPCSSPRGQSPATARRSGASARCQMAAPPRRPSSPGAAGGLRPGTPPLQPHVNCSVAQALETIRARHLDFAANCNILLLSFERHQAVAAQEAHDSRRAQADTALLLSRAENMIDELLRDMCTLVQRDVFRVGVPVMAAWDGGWVTAYVHSSTHTRITVRWDNRTHCMLHLSDVSVRTSGSGTDLTFIMQTVLSSPNGSIDRFKHCMINYVELLEHHGSEPVSLPEAPDAVRLVNHYNCQRGANFALFMQQRLASELPERAIVHLERDESTSLMQSHDASRHNNISQRQDQSNKADAPRGPHSLNNAQGACHRLRLDYV